jgi:hypothetical protein
VAVGVEGDLDGGVAQKLGNELHVHALPQQERGARVPKVVETERPRQTGPFGADLERPVEVAPAHGGPDLGVEYEAVLLPQPCLPHALFKLALAVRPEGAHGPPGEREMPPAAALGGLEAAASVNRGLSAFLCFYAALLCRILNADFREFLF